ncbi:anosmin-1-like [Tubulanus polymorphus]|uniref:anosmin-1-like n=1 Tax=Tubulanus polymorphus TaxID=672921 RepID=UPI003DA21B12
MELRSSFLLRIFVIALTAISSVFTATFSQASKSDIDTSSTVHKRYYDESICKRVFCPAGYSCHTMNVFDLYPCPPGQYCKPIHIGICKSGMKKGKCPSVDVNTHVICHADWCTYDSDCRGIEKCCSRGCGRSCMKPVSAATGIRQYFHLK